MPECFSILHVEDDPDYSELLQLQISSISKLSDRDVNIDFHNVPDVASANEAVDCNVYDCVVCDYQIHGGTGLDVLAHIRSHSLLLPVIFLTGQGDESVARDAFVRGADDYFTKESSIAHYDRIYNAILHQISHYNIERKHSELEKRYYTSQKKYFTLFQNAPDAIFLMNGTSFIDCNPSAVSLLGYTYDELKSLSPHKISPEMQPDGSDSFTLSKVYLSRAINGSPQRFVWQHRTNDGTDIMTEVRLTPIFYEDEVLLMAIIRDISPLMGLSVELKENKRRLSSLIENIPGIAYQCSLEFPWNLQYVSRGCEQLLGYSRSTFLSSPLGSFGSVIHPDDVPTVIKAVNGALSSRCHFDIEYRMRRFDGSYIRVFERGRKIVDENGASYLEGYITKKSLDADMLPHTLFGHSDIIDSFPLAVITYAVSNGELTHEYSNAAAESIPPIQEGGKIVHIPEYISTKYHHLILGKDPYKEQQSVSVLRYDSIQGEQYYRMRMYWHSLTSIIVILDGFSHQAELGTRSENAHKSLGRVMELISDINILDIDMVLSNVAEYIRSVVPYDGMVVFAIDKERNIFVPRYCDDELRDAMMSLSFPIDIGVTGRVAKNGVPEIVNSTHQDKDAVHIPGTPDEEERMLCVPLIAHKGIIGTMNLYRDSEDFALTDLREISRISGHVATALENALLYEKISKEYDFINFLISLLSHDLQNPLMVNDSMIDMIEDGEDAIALVPKIRWANQRIKNILARTRIFAHLEYGLIEREFKERNVSSLMAEVQEHFQNHPKENRLSVSCSCDTCTIYALDIFPHIVINLVDNALKYGTTCNVTCYPTGGDIEIRVADDGIGIPTSKQSLIFSKYARLDKDSTVSGSGIGLFVAKHLVELHNGSISIGDNYPSGVVFTITVPKDCRNKVLSTDD